VTPSEFVAACRKLVAGDRGHYRKLELIEGYLTEVAEDAPPADVVEDDLPADADPFSEGADASVQPVKKGRAKRE
jgi:hypothetical protein